MLILKIFLWILMLGSFLRLAFEYDRRSLLLWAGRDPDYFKPVITAVLCIIALILAY